jgi:hypothetical protein
MSTNGRLQRRRAASVKGSRLKEQGGPGWKPGPPLENDAEAPSVAHVANAVTVWVRRRPTVADAGNNSVSAAVPAPTICDLTAAQPSGRDQRDPTPRGRRTVYAETLDSATRRTGQARGIRNVRGNNEGGEPCVARLRFLAVDSSIDGSGSLELRVTSLELPEDCSSLDLRRTIGYAGGPGDAEALLENQLPGEPHSAVDLDGLVVGPLAHLN